ncbi:MAG TPA: YceI family protein [Bryobacteraceae bacterium]|nr:YceI family protein [Bryobacteraceae bacterium]
MTWAMHYVLDKNASRFTVRAFAVGMLSAFGHNPVIAIRDFSGEADFNPDAPDTSCLQIHIRADSLEVTDDIKAKDRQEMESTMKQQVLASERYPEIVFEGSGTSANRISDALFRLNLNGTLFLRGKAGRISIPAQIAFMGGRLRASGEFSLLQSEYGIQPVSVAGGALKLKDEIKFAFDIVAQARE